MENSTMYNSLTSEQIDQLQGNGCFADDWQQIKVASGFEPARVKNTTFKGAVNIGSNVCIENVGLLEATEGAGFGNGIEINVINEAGGREVPLFNELSAQFAYLLSMHRHRPEFTEKLKTIAAGYIEANKQRGCVIGDGSIIRCVKEIIDVNIGPAAVINGASSLVNGTVLSSADASAKIGQDVIAKDFIIAEGAVVESAAYIEKVFVGQGSIVGKGFTAEQSLMFSNCEFFNGEAVSIFAGPFTVSHHKSTLLIAGMFSFFNAGSGTNQSNHMYRLGPVHEGKLCRGAKTGSFSYMLWPSVVGAFSVVLGKHSGSFDLVDLPFSRIIPGANGKTYVQPGVQFYKSGTVRDCMKWPKRDRRTSANKRDNINFEMLNPFTVGKMITAKKLLASLLENSGDEISFNGATIKRADIQKAVRIYKFAAEIYLLEKIVNHAISQLEQGYLPGDICTVDPNASNDSDWIDIAGQIAPKAGVEKLYDFVETGQVGTIEAFAEYFTGLNNRYAANEWAWVVKTFEQVFGDSLSVNSIPLHCDRLLRARTDIVEALISDAEKEYSAQSRIGYGFDGIDGQKDFENVHGSLKACGFIETIQNDLSELERSITLLKQRLG